MAQPTLNEPSPEEAARELIRRRKAGESLHEFVRQAWPQVESGRDFVDGWHIVALCEHLEALHRGEIRNLLINVPPRTSKSTTCSVMFPAWVWSSQPNIQFLYTAYAQNISVRDSRRCRALIQSRWYQSRWGHQFQIVSDQDTKIRFDNDKNGYRIASSVEGQNTGEGGDYIVCVPGGTLVSTEEGALPIEEIVTRRMDVRIRTFDHLRNQLSWSTIDNWHENGVRQLYSLTTDSGHNLHLTGNHEVYLAGEGYVPTRALVRGDELVVGSEQPHISKLVEAVKIGTARVYNLTLVPHRNYFANGVLVHNCDDPNNVRDQSDTVLDSTLDWWTNVMPTRLNDFKTGRRLVIQQRTHERDLSGHIMENDKEAKDWVKLILPMEFESKRRCITVKLPSTVGKWFDPRKSDGELLTPERVGPKELARLKRELSALGGSYAISGQLQQLPAPDEGGIIKKNWFQLWKSAESPPIEFTLLSVDTALTAKKTSAFSVATTWGIFKDAVTNTPNIILLSMFRDKVEYPELRARLQRMAVDYLDDGPTPRNVPPEARRRPNLILIEAKVSGHSLIQDLSRAGVFARPNDPDKLGDKLQRVRLITHILEAGRVWVPANPPKFDKARAYGQLVIDQAAAFPNAASRDIVDTMTQALHFFQSFSFVNHPTDEKWEPVPRTFTGEAAEPLY